MSSWKSLLLRIGDKSPEYGTSSDFKDHIVRHFLSPFSHLCSSIRLLVVDFYLGLAGNLLWCDSAGARSLWRWNFTCNHLPLHIHSLFGCCLYFEFLCRLKLYWLGHCISSICELRFSAGYFTFLGATLCGKRKLCLTYSILMVFTLFFVHRVTVPSAMCWTIAAQDSFVRDIGKLHYAL